MVGAFVGAVLVFVFYMKHYDVTGDADGKLATFSTGPNIRHIGLNLFVEWWPPSCWSTPSCC